MAHVVLDNVTKEYGGCGGAPVPALRGISLEVKEAELLVVLGPSGGGKSTLLRLIAGLEEVGGGTVWINGAEVNRVPPEDRDVAMVFQHHALHPHLTAFGNLALPLRLRRLGEAQIEARVTETADMLGLLPCLNRLPAQLSGGERQRVGLGRALVRRPGILLCDEPLSNLDAPWRTQLRGEIAAVQARLGTTMLYVTHDQEEAMALGSRLAVMKDGELLQIGPPMEIYDFPVNRFVGGFVGSPSMNFLHGTLLRKGYTLYFRLQSSAAAEGTELTVLQVADETTASLTRYVDRELILGLRPEDISLAAGSDAGGLAATVERVERLGAVSQARLRIGSDSMMVRLDSSALFRKNDVVSVTCRMARAHFFDPASGHRAGSK